MIDVGSKMGLVKTYSIGGSAYKSWHSIANNEETYKYVFNLKTLSLIGSDIDNQYDANHRYTCQIWNKQPWWSL